MTFSTFVYVYIFGGITFIPLLIASILIPAWLWLPQIGDATSNKAQDEGLLNPEEKQTSEKLLAEHEEKTTSDGAASGTFAVLRSYNFQTANIALNARNSNAGVAGGANVAEGSGEPNTTSESVYQSMYRTVFDRTKGAGTNNSVLEKEEASQDPNNKVKRKATPVNVFYIVLRHGHLMLYDSAAQMEVRLVISLAHHDVSLSEGLVPGEEEDLMKDGDLFIRRTAIVLTPTELQNGSLQSRSTPPKPFYLFSSTCSEKEDFYHALLYTRKYPPIPQPLDPNDTIKLQSTLHSTSITQETRALNAMIGRVFLALYQTDRLKNLIRTKVEKKISRVQKPAFIAALAVQSVNLGDAAPVLSNPRLRDLNISGDMTIAFDIRYSGGVKLTVSALAKLDLGPRFKTRTVDLVLATSLQRLQGHMLVRIKPPPSNRIWFCFESMPEMDIKVEPVVSQRQITYTFILRAIEERIRAVVAETLVKPNWDDVSFFDTRDQLVRGGIWKDEGGDPSAPSAADMLKAKNEKTMSMPVLNSGTDPDSSATSSGSEMPPKTTADLSTSASVKPSPNHLKRRSVASLPARNASTSALPTSESSDHGTAAGVDPPPPLRSPSFASASASAASVALDESAANEPWRAGETQAQPPPSKWRLRGAAPQQMKRDAVDVMREMRDRALADRKSEDGDEHLGSTEDLTGAEDTAEDQTDSLASASTATPSPSTTSFADRSLRSSKRTDTNLTTATGASSSTTRSQQQRKTILSATAAATTAARNWSWNAIANRTKNSPTTRNGSVSSISGQQQEPMGRGQPLPPPGMPLPGPQKGLFGNVGMGSVKRKPVLPPRRSVEDDLGRDVGEKSGAGVNISEVQGEEGGAETRSPTGDEFGPWRENSGIDETDLPSRAKSDNDGAEAVAVDAADFVETPVQATKKVPPPLPARRRPAPEQDEPAHDSAPTSDGNEDAVPIGDASQLIDLGEPNHDSTNKDRSADKIQPAPGDSTSLPTADLAEMHDEATHMPAHSHDNEEGIGTDRPSHRGEIPDDGDEDTDDLVAIPAPVDDDAIPDSASGDAPSSIEEDKSAERPTDNAEPSNMSTDHETDNQVLNDKANAMGNAGKDAHPA